MKISLTELLQIIADKTAFPTTDELATAIITQLKAYMDPKLQTVMDKLQEIKDETGQYIADRDAQDVAKDAINAAQAAEIARLVAEAEAGKITLAELRDGLDAAAVKASEAADLLPPLRVPPVSVSFATNFPAPSQPAFDDAKAAYVTAGGKDAIELDGIEVSPGTSGTTLKRYSHSASGDINDQPPTD